ncbi:S41 family peptidase [Janthinobacterium agaricidamnosum]|uniref:C-terminal processing peptidase family protein n=1 Tax=Janthinobacterium agaricidamnosum NBRC 102515 = DSM 9628 TaxID=1349767 RepID=W0VDJ7_9BURK|nr:S41 family peptidase [Janthinobacterium agaricidamnosum]CDG85750.1 C-terminal processing peptidase family protein [Janthinobacterium agaricidamnosum NBRC 102515 = DSM 9628]
MGKLKNTGLIGLGVVAGVAVSLQFSAMAQKPVEPALPLEQLRQLADVFGLIKSDYVEPVEDKKLLTDAISGMVASLDPHSAYLDKQAYAELREGSEGKFVGLGIEIGQSEDGYIKIVAPIEDSPAYRAGIKPGDLITRLDATPVKGMSLDDSVKKMRGEPGSKVTLTIARKDAPQPLVFVITREEIHQKSVKSKLIEPGYAWVRVSQFQEPTVDDMAAQISALYQQDPHIKGLILDLRNDPGGVLQGAIGVSAAFLPKNAAIVSTNGQLPDSKQVFYGSPQYYALRSEPDALAKLPAALKTVPMVVLVNTGSASASEIVAGALQDYKRAIILGSQTFGKGSVQTIRQLTADTAVKLTTARYYTPNGRSIQAKGIVPDLMVDENADGDGLNSLRMREADLSKHLSNDRDKDTQDKLKGGEQAGVHDELEEQLRAVALEKTHKPLEYGARDDFQLAQALNHLKGLPVQLAKAESAIVQADTAKKTMNQK